MLKQGLYQKQLLKLSPQQIQLLKLLMVPTASLDQRIKEELEANPALEESEREGEEEVQPSTDETPSLDSETENEADDEELKLDDEVDMTEYYDEDDEGVAEYKTADPNAFHDPEDDKKTIPASVDFSFHEYLESQAGMLNLDERKKEIALQLIGSLDDDGYLRRDLEALTDDLVFGRNINTNVDELLEVLKEIQKLDPPGVGARTLEECLLLQLKRKDDPTIYSDIAIQIIEKHFELFARKHYEKLRDLYQLEEEQMRWVMEEITHLNPKPGSAFAGNNGGARLTIIPDYILTNQGGELQVSLQARNAPELRISNHFKEMIEEYQKSKDKSKSQREAMLFVKQKIDAAQWFIDAIHTRYNTMMVVMQSILELQKDYLSTGDETQIKPMILKDIADRTGLDVSTVSRVTSSKYVQTEFGTIPLKFFFSEAIATDSGEDASSREVKRIVMDLIGAEDKSNPISDQELTDLLQQKGYHLARRTVAKYREQLHIPVARLRRKL